MEQQKKMAVMLKLLANEHRLSILCTLRNGGRTVTQIHECVPDISLSALSQHLGQMKLAGLLTSQKHGLHVVYAIGDPNIFQFLDRLQAYTAVG